MRIAICEDIADDSRQLQGALYRYLESNSLAADVDCFTSGEAFLSAFKPGKYQIIFMDIYMKKGGVTGVDAAEEVKNADKDASLIFTTTSEDYLRAGYRLSVYYIVKPVDDGELAEAMGKCRAQIERYARTFEVMVDREPVQIRRRSIFFVESMGRNCVFLMEKGDITASGISIDGLAKKLGGFPFVQCHRCYVINLLHVKAMKDKDFLLENGKRVPIGRAYQTDAGQAFKRYALDRIQGITV